MAAAHQVPVAGGGHGGGIVRIVHQENPASRQLDTGILTVESHLVAGFVGDTRHHVQIAGIVTVNDVHRQPERFQYTQRAGRDHVAAMQYSLGARCFGGAYCGLQQWAMIVAVRDNTDFHIQKFGFSGAFLNISMLSRISFRASSMPAQPSTRTHLPSSRSL